MSMHERNYDSPIGTIYIGCDEKGITEISFDKISEHQDEHPLLMKTVGILDAYFNGKEVQDILPVHINGTPFRMKVWNKLCDIPYGTTVSYQSIARMFSDTMSSQAIGQAVHHNPISILIPCHRVIGKNGSLIGYGGGLNRKKYLLELEKTERKFDITVAWKME